MPEKRWQDLSALVIAGLLAILGTVAGGGHQGLLGYEVGREGLSVEVDPPGPEIRRGQRKSQVA